MVFKASLVYFISAGLSAAIGFLVTVFLTQALTPDAMAKISIFQIMGMFWATIIGLGTAGSINLYHIRLNQDEFSQHLLGCAAVGIISAILLFIIATLCSGVIERYTNTSLTIIYLSITYASTQFFSQIRLNIWQSQKEPIKHSAFQTTLALLTAIFTVLATMMIYLDERSRIYAMVAASVIGAIYAIATTYHQHIFHLKTTAKRLTEALAYGIPLVPQAIAVIAVTMSDRLLITNLIDEYTTGIYFVAWQFSFIVLMIGDSLAKALRPKMLSAYNRKNTTEAKQLLKLGCLIIITAGTLVTLTTYLVYPLVIGSEYMAGHILATLLTLSATIQTIYYPFSNIFFYRRSTIVLMKISLFSTAFYIITSYFVLPKYGILGLSITNLVNSFILVIFIGLSAKKEIKLLEQ